MYKRNFRYRKSRYTKKGIPKAVIPKKVTDAHIAKVAKKTMRIRQEEKQFNAAYFTKVPINNEFVTEITGGVNQNLYRLNTDINQGDASFNRDGLQIEAVRALINAKFELFQTPSITNANQINDTLRYRVMVFWYAQDDNNVLAVSDYPQARELFNIVTPYTLPSSQVDCTYNNVFKHKFHMLYDRTYSLSNLGPTVRSMKLSIPLKNKKIHYMDSVTDKNSPIDKALFLLIVSDNPDGSGFGTSPAVNFDMNYSFIFRDI